MVILAIDYGDARTGLAVCDKTELLASPAGVIHETYAPRLIEKLRPVIAEHHPEQLVVGLPKNMDGSFGPRAAQCAAFAETLETTFGIQTVTYDERLTTVAAHRALNNVNVRGKKRKNVVDAVAAVMILEDYLRARRAAENQD
ncbi:MAG: Holliday junction resolvase RuvX [Clostridia bacterium]|nr:Holliday junction resolvase RuvX [Clostridia bacterium]MBR3552451.1 Holliday junction resolvase RuvX [Clostridia bacterium]